MRAFGNENLEGVQLGEMWLTKRRGRETGGRGTIVSENFREMEMCSGGSLRGWPGGAEEDRSGNDSG